MINYNTFRRTPAVLLFLLLTCVSAQAVTNLVGRSLPRGQASDVLQRAMQQYFDVVSQSQTNIHSIMVVQHGKVVAARWLGDGRENEPHELWSVSKTFTATAVGFAVAEHRLRLTDRLVDFFPDKLPAHPSENLQAITIRDLLTMTCGHDVDPMSSIVNAKDDNDWARLFLAVPVVHKPGTFYCYNSVGTYMLSAIVQKVTGQRVVDYLYPRLFEPLGIDRPQWKESPQGINAGGWGLFLKTEDLAKMGQLLLQRGKWNGHRLLPSRWVKAATSRQVSCQPSGVRSEALQAAGLTPENSDWVQGYGYQIWRCRHNAYRADGAYGQYIIVLPEKDAVIAVTANVGNMQGELNQIWDNILPAL